jgi:hypothetical protein
MRGSGEAWAVVRFSCAKDCSTEVAAAAYLHVVSYQVRPAASARAQIARIPQTTQRAAWSF